MPPPYTPILIDGVVYPHFPEPQNQRFGPFYRGGKAYAVLVEETVVTGNSFVRIYSRAKAAAANTQWFELDAANHPQTNFAVAGVYYDGADTITVAYVDSSTTYLRQFDLVSEQWQSVISSFNDVVPNDFLHVRPDGSDWVLYYSQDVGSGFLHAHWRKWDGATWSSPVHVSTNISTSTDASAAQVVVDGSGLFHLVWRELGAGAKAGYSRTLDPSTGTLGSIATMVPVGTGMRQAGTGLEWDSKIAIPFSSTAFGSSGRPTVAFGSPASAPVWSLETVDATENAATDTTLVEDPNTGDLYCWWLTTQAIKYASKPAGGSWSAPVTWYAWFGQQYYSSDGLTLINWPGGNFFHNLSVSFGSWEVLAGGFVDGFSTMFYLPGTDTQRRNYSYLGKTMGSFSTEGGYSLLA